MARMLVAIAGLVAATAALATASPTHSRPALSTSCGRFADYAPAWAPNGRAVAFTRLRGSDSVSQIYRIGIDGHGLRRISGVADYSYGAAWSPDGARIAYNNFDLAAVVHIVIARSDGTAAHSVGSFQSQREPPATFLTWSPDGSRLAYVGSAGDLIVAASAGGGDQRVIAHGATQPSWSPSGDRIAYVGLDGIVVASADGENARLIANGALPRWSPDGRWLAYTSRSGAGVHVIGADGTGDRVVDRTGSYPAWSRDGRRLVDATESNGRRYGVIHVIELSRGRVVTVSHDASRRYGSDDFSPAFDSKSRGIVFTSVPALGGSELRLVRADGHGERRLTYHCGVVDEGRGSRVYGTWLDDIILARNHLRDTIVCGGGVDVVVADRDDRVAGSCETVRR
jgi:Tol biopolymer transport system component